MIYHMILIKIYSDLINKILYTLQLSGYLRESGAGKVPGTVQALYMYMYVAEEEFLS